MMKSWISILAALASAVVAPSQTTSFYLLNDDGAVTLHAGLDQLRTAVTAAAAAGDFCGLSAWRMDIAIVNGAPSATPLALTITAAGADVEEPVAGVPEDCDGDCQEARAASPDPPGVPLERGDACDCFAVLEWPPARRRSGEPTL